MHRIKEIDDSNSEFSLFTPFENRDFNVHLPYSWPGGGGGLSGGGGGNFETAGAP